MKNEKKTYRQPNVIIYGGLTDLTRMVGTNAKNDSVQGQNNLKTA